MKYFLGWILGVACCIGWNQLTKYTDMHTEMRAAHTKSTELVVGIGADEWLKSINGTARMAYSGGMKKDDRIYTITLTDETRYKKFIERLDELAKDY